MPPSLARPVPPVSRRLFALAGLLLAGVLAAAPPGAAAQPVGERPLQGVVWQVPEETAQALRELEHLAGTGVEALRTGLVADTTVLARADSLGLRLFQEVPVEILPASALRDTVEAVARLLRPALRRARGHPSARHFGLARRSDTSDPAACAYFEALTDLVHREGPPGSQTYYLTPFAETDRCAAAVDLVLLDARDAPEPAALLRRYRAAHADSLRRPVGIGALGAAVRPEAGEGLRRPGSPERQARRLEDALAVLLPDTLGADPPGVDSLATPPAAVFVYRWRDAPEAAGRDAAERRYGLLAEDGAARRALDVVQGFYTGRQRVFAFEAGTAPAPEWPWLLLVGWGVVAALGLAYTLSTRMRRMVPRYFGARGFYRDAVREGRELMEGATTLLLALMGVSLGVTATAALHVAARHDALETAVRLLPDGLHAALVTVLAQPWIALLAVAAALVAGALVWAVVLALLARGQRPLSTPQALVLVVWPRWTFLPLMAAALVLTTLPTPTALAALPYLAGAFGVLYLYAVLRTLRDFRAVAFAGPARVLAALAFSPFLLGLLLLGAALLQYRYEVAFLWHLVTRT